MSFRKIDIDAYDEDVLREGELCEPDTRDPTQVLSDANRSRQHTTHLRGDIPGTLGLALDSIPYGPNIEEARNLTLQTVISILNSTKSSEILSIVKALSQDAQDTLMKHLYKGMGMPGWGDVSGSVLLGWHEKLTEVAGTGCIVRAMTDRRTA
ncbi:actin-related protein 2/3 complex subunit 5 [Suillus tomentosus]|nr:actin-related protein 2/3 complex subunit 5 [Suillus tomentosus]